MAPVALGRRRRPRPDRRPRRRADQPTRTRPLPGRAGTAIERRRTHARAGRTARCSNSSSSPAALPPTVTVVPPSSPTPPTGDRRADRRHPRRRSDPLVERNAERRRTLRSGSIRPLVPIGADPDRPPIVTAPSNSADHHVDRPARPGVPSSTRCATPSARHPRCGNADPANRMRSCCRSAFATDGRTEVVTLDLSAERAVAIAGSEGFRSALARTLVIEAATLHGPADVDVVVLTDPDRVGAVGLGEVAATCPTRRSARHLEFGPRHRPMGRRCDRAGGVPRRGPRHTSPWQSSTIPVSGTGATRRCARSWRTLRTNCD